MPNSNHSSQKTKVNPPRDPLTNNAATAEPEQPEPSRHPEPQCKQCEFRTLHSEPSSTEAGPCPEPSVKTVRDRIFQAFDYLETRWDPSQWLGLGAILFHLTDGSEEGQHLFEYWSFYHHPDFDDSTGVSHVWEWFSRGGRGTTSMRTIRCFMAAGFELDQLIPESPLLAEDDVPLESTCASVA